MKYFAVILALLLLLNGCYKQSPKKSINKTENLNIISATSTTKQKIAEKNTIEIVSSGFAPNDFSIREKTSVRWINKDKNPHILRFSDKTESPILKFNDEFIKTFDQAGQYRYDCAIHTYMKGVIIVEN